MKCQQSTRFVKRHFSLSKSPTWLLHTNKASDLPKSSSSPLSCGSTRLWRRLACPLCVPASPPCSQTMCSSALCVAVRRHLPSARNPTKERLCQTRKIAGAHSPVLHSPIPSHAHARSHTYSIKRHESAYTRTPRSVTGRRGGRRRMRRSRARRRSAFTVIMLLFLCHKMGHGKKKPKEPETI